MNKFTIAFNALIAFAKLAGPPRTNGAVPANWSMCALVGESSVLVTLYGVSYIVWDNGGEVGVERINSGVSRFFPLSYHGSRLDTGTLYVRLCCALLGEKIDYSYRAGLELDDVKK